MATLLARVFQPSVTNHPPTKAELRRNDIIVIIWFLFALFLGIGIRNRVLSASSTVELGEGLPSLAIPARWITGSDADSVVYARNPRSPSIFDAEMRVSTRPLKAGENLVLARTALGAQRTQRYNYYRELFAEKVTVLNGVEGSLVTYAYVADPTRNSGAVAPPVVVQAQDLIFVTNGNLVVVSVAADAGEWEDDQRDFDAIFNSLNLRVTEETEREIELNPVGAGTLGGGQ